MAEDIQSLAERKHWTVKDSVATYAPHTGRWIARVRTVRMAGHSYERWHVAIIDPGGTARHVSFASLLGEATRVAEGSVRGRNGASTES